MKWMAALAPLVVASNAWSQNLQITITNLTQGTYFTPLLIAAHSSDAVMFRVGQYASPELQAIAEVGDISSMGTLLTSVSANMVENPADGLLAPGESIATTLENLEGNDYLSLASMLLPTNDGFVGLDSWMIPTEPGTYTINLNAYDAGTEANDEIVNGAGAPGEPGIPVAPGMDAGIGGTGVTSTEDNTLVHIHRGNLGDDDPNGGKSDLDNTVHRWLNPVAVVTIVVN
nr:spondin domain-containing protein [Thalassotalea mangrovi]